MSTDEFTFDGAVRRTACVDPPLILEEQVRQFADAGRGLQASGSIAKEDIQAIIAAIGGSGCKNLSTVSIAEFISAPGRADRECLVIGLELLGRCALEGLKAARSRLREGGILWIYQIHDGGVNVSSTDAATPPVPDNSFRWIFCLRQAERCGFDPVVSYSLALDSGRPVAAGCAWVSVAAARLAGHTEPSTALTLGTVAAEHSAEVRALFAGIFAPAQMTSAHWEWKYSNNRGVGVGAWRSDALVAHYGGVWRTIAIDGTTRLAVQITDVMVSPRERGVMGRRGAFALVAPSFAECFVGDGAKALIGFGFPNERHFKAAEKRGLYGEVDRIVEIRWPATDESARVARFFFRTEIVEADTLRRDVRELNALWRVMRNGLPNSIVGVRDQAYLVHRYVNNPVHQYEYVSFHLPFLHRRVGLAVLKISETSVEVRDVIARPDRIKYCIIALRSLARLRGLELSLWITRSHKNLCWVPGGTESETGIVIPISTWTNGPSVESIRGRWWLTSGDTDFL